MKILNIISCKYYILMICYVSLFIPSLLWAAPTITNCNGNVSHGSSITISGSGFGTKSQAAPLLWENFEGGTVGQLLSTDPDWATQIECTTNYDGGIPSQIFSNDRGYGQGSKSAKLVLVDDAPCWARTKLGVLGNQTQLFVSYHFYEVSGGHGILVKMGRIGSQNDVHSYPDMGYTAYVGGESNGGYYYVFADSRTEHVIVEDVPNAVGTWTREDMWAKLSSNGASNGAVGVWRNNRQLCWNTSVNTKNAGSNYTAYNQWFMPYYSQSGTRTFYIDDVYIDNTLARVEIGNASTWSACTLKEIQIPTAWSPGSITVKVNRGKFGSTDTAYLYVVDSTGAVNSSGYPITFGSGGSGGDTTSPVSPSGINVQLIN